MIRKLLVAVAVLGLAGSGAFAQGVSFSGSAGMGVIHHGSTKMVVGDGDGYEVTNEESKIEWRSDFDISISASGTTDGGLTFGASTAIEAGEGSGESAVDDSKVYIGGESWTVTIGSLDPASDKGKVLGDVGYAGLGVDDVVENIKSYTLGGRMYGGDGAAGQGTDANVEVSFNLGTASLAITAAQSGGSKFDVGLLTAVDETGKGDDVAAKKEDTVWAAGVSFAVGSTNLGIGMDSEKLIQAGISADLGAFGGKLFFSQQKTDGPLDADATATGITDADDSKADKYGENKKTGIGVELSVSAGANTTINAVYAQGKQTDIRSEYDSNITAADSNSDNGLHPTGDKIGKTDKGFGIGVSHNLGGGATLQAGFAKVRKQTKASVGVTMSF